MRFRRLIRLFLGLTLWTASAKAAPFACGPQLIKLIQALGFPEQPDVLMQTLSQDAAQPFQAVQNRVGLLSGVSQEGILPLALVYPQIPSPTTLSVRYVQLHGFRMPYEGQAFPELPRTAVWQIRTIAARWAHELNSQDIWTTLRVERARYSYFDPAYPLLHTVESRPELPLFPTVFNFNTSYLRNLLSVALPEARALKAELNRELKVLVLGSGAGVDAALLARELQSPVDAVDINYLAVANTKATAATLGVDSLVNAFKSDGFDQIPSTHRYDLIVFNAPIPGPEVETSRPNTIDPGGQLITRIFTELSHRLSDGGKLVMMNNRELYRFLPTHWRTSEQLRFKDEMDGDFIVFGIQP